MVVWTAFGKIRLFELKACNEYIVEELEWNQMAVDQFVPIPFRETMMKLVLLVLSS